MANGDEGGIARRGEGNEAMNDRVSDVLNVIECIRQRLIKLMSALVVWGV